MSQDQDIVDLQIETESILMDGEPTTAKTFRRRLYEQSVLNIELYFH